MSKDTTTVQTELFNTITECKSSRVVGADDKVILLLCEIDKPLKNVNPTVNVSDKIGALHFDEEKGFMVFQSPDENHVIIVVNRQIELLVTAVTAAIEFNLEKDH